MSESSLVPESQNKPNHQVGARTFGIVTLAIFASRILGLIREMILSALFGGPQLIAWLDCFKQAFRTPNLLRDLFAEGALSTAFVTTFSQKIKTEGDESAWNLARKMLTLAAVFMSLIAIGGVLLAPVIIRFLNPGWIAEAPEKIEFTVYLARIMYPFILLVSLAALVMGMLNAKKVFGMPALSSSFFNLGSMIAGGILGWFYDPTFGKGALVGFAIGTLVGGLAQLVVQFPSLRRIGFRFRPDFGWRDPGVRRVLNLMWPAVISGSVVQVNVMMNNIFASCLVLKDGPVTWMDNAFRLIQLPLGLFGVAVATVTLPAMSRLAIDGITEDFKATLSRGLKLVFLMTVPSAVGMALLAEPIISLIFERGRYTPHDVEMSAIALRSYAWGLVFYSGIKVIQPAFYTIEKRFVPLLVSAIAVVISGSMNAFTVFVLKLGHDYLALSTSISAFINFSLLYLFMRKTANGLHGRDLGINMLKLLASAAAMAAICVAAKYTILASWDQQRFLIRCLTLFGTIGAAAGVYFLVNAVLKNEEIEEFKTVILRKFRRR